MVEQNVAIMAAIREIVDDENARRPITYRSFPPGIQGVVVGDYPIDIGGEGSSYCRCVR